MKKIITLALLCLYSSLALSSSPKNFVINGILVPEGEIPSVFNLPDGCTATFVGARTFITSAHCLSNKEETQTIFGKKAKLKQHPLYQPKNFTNGTYVDYFDFAVGTFSEAINKPSSENPATICKENASSELIGQTSLLVGYGCNQWPSGSGGGTKRYGYAKIAEIKADFLKTVIGPNGGLSCPGDSGGPHFLVKADKSYCFIATNFHSDRTKENRATNIFNPKTMDWFKAQIKESGDQVCGINVGCPTDYLPPSMNKRN